MRICLYIYFIYVWYKKYMQNKNCSFISKKKYVIALIVDYLRKNYK